MAPDGNQSTDPSALGGNNIFENNIIDGCRAGGGVIHYHGADNNVVRNNIIRNFGTASPWAPPNETFVQYGTGFTIGGDGVWGSPGPSNNKIYNNLIYHATGQNRPSECFNLWGTGTGNLVYNNTCYDVGVGVRLGASTINGVDFVNNIFSHVPTPQQLNGGTIGVFSNNLADPNGTLSTFMNAGNFDFRLQDGSAAIAQGADLHSVFTTDFSGLTRAVPWDIGAYKYISK
jgi:hypothetical protein